MDYRRLRIGQGFDSHQFADDRKLVLGGVTIPYDRGLLGHSDADAVIHALIDALLGAVGYGSIGELFPPDEPKYKDRSSIEFLHLVASVIQDDWEVINADITIIAQQPRLQPFVTQMRATLATVMKLQPEQISLKVKSAEKMGALGRVEGIAVLSSALLYQIDKEVVN